MAITQTVCTSFKKELLEGVHIFGSSFTARGALIYNDTQGDKAVMVLDFGANKTSNNSTFTVAMPASTASTALIRIT